MSEQLHEASRASMIASWVAPRAAGALLIGLGSTLALGTPAHADNAPAEAAPADASPALCTGFTGCLHAFGNSAYEGGKQASKACVISIFEPCHGKPYKPAPDSNLPSHHLPKSGDFQRWVDEGKAPSKPRQSGGGGGGSFCKTYDTEPVVRCG